MFHDGQEREKKKEERGKTPGQPRSLIKPKRPKLLLHCAQTVLSYTNIHGQLRLF